MRLTISTTFLSLLLLVTACTKSDQPVPTPSDTYKGTSTLSGTYKGTFQRNNASSSGQISQVSLTFADAKWTGTSQIQKYPALCSGTYEVSSSNEITFVNACIWTAEFDWTLILSGKYTLVMKDDELELSKTTGSSQDIYRLRRE
ncbi:hypothetical protein [Hymenobacter arizonensis]|uniref:Lipocalin-like domain-containing protein n=1 Tax=Hymenobacter arizonensis TaxID=1227077 RepID=A0A1I5SWZ3_HYMAR|nr:hypothetical protein [Hymenobacter arizonensis]SFP75312.1 hypothetical protein SAMN04515668_0228 [Hymenobacter arizonensis]